MSVTHSSQVKQVVVVIVSFVVMVTIPVSVYLLNSQSQDIRNQAAMPEFDVNTYRGLARFGGDMAPDVFNTSVTVEEWEEYQFGWYHSWRLWHGYSFDNVDSSKMPERTTIPPKVEFSGMISPGWGWAEPIIAGCTQEVKDELAEYKDGDTIWVGNEPGWGDARDPHRYAQSYKSWYDCIKSVNPNIRVSPGAFNPLYSYKQNMKNWTNKVDPLDNANPRWDVSDPADIKPAGGINFIQYLTYAMESYESLYGNKMPVDAFVIHTYNFTDDHFGSSGDVPSYVATVENEIRAFRQWMKDNGFRRLPLTTKETGFLIPDPVLDPDGNADKWASLAERMEALLSMYHTLKDSSIGNPNDNNRLVQRWSWFVAGNPDPCEYGTLNVCGWQDSSFVLCPGISGHIAVNCDNQATRITTPLGQAYKTYIAGIAAAYDKQQPASPEIEYTLSGTTAQISFSANDNGRVNDYEISVGSVSGKTDVVLWQSTNTATTYSLDNAVGKFVNVKAIDDGYNWSPVSSVKINDSSCTPDCSGKECGGDGCGGSCGTCSAGEVCSDGHCTGSGSKADIDRNGSVNMSDYGLFVDDYLTYRDGGGLRDRSDLNGDGKISMSDYSVFVQEYLEARAG